MILVRRTPILTRNNSAFTSWVVLCGSACKIRAWEGVLYTFVGSGDCMKLQARHGVSWPT
jgi:hypothetical protein